MEFKRQFTKDASGQLVCTGVLVKHTGTDAEQKFSRRMVEQAMAEGWMRIEGNQLIVAAQPEDLRYTITREPGYYVASTGERIPVSSAAWTRLVANGAGDISSKEVRAWLAKRGLEETDYELPMAYECVLDAAQHAEFAITTTEG